MSLLTAYDAHRLQREEGWTQLDVRTHEEFMAGHAHGAVNIPFVYTDGRPNDCFLTQIAEKFGKDDKLIVCCSSGRYSSRAVVRLAAAGYNNLADLFGGHQQWRLLKLPVNINYNHQQHHHHHHHQHHQFTSSSSS